VHTLARTAHRTSTSASKVDASSKFAALSLATLVVALLFAPLVNGQSLGEMADDLLHSDLPLFGHGGDNEWPQHFNDGDSFGCTSRVAFGDWVFRKRNDAEEDYVLWYRFSNYGVFHCWANTFRANERSKLDGANFHPSFFVLLGRTSVSGQDVELWTIQVGARPGSDYVLLSRAPVHGLIETFTVLQTACPRANVREGGSLDILLSRYCAVNSRGELSRLARRMARRPPLGTLTRVPADDETTQDTRE
jgi:hypothetical protein